ncbi:hypothetical protein F0562_002617 [Nyssa sinensis]|uniref:Uncharacterized protein n=1 Tax=Nyssa sinensis TaxID=561372 RepID=A0A5J5C6D3_9ASTE|nr:hypothetical protein F0562_002617 [Nyssa sinensis]
MDRAHPETFRHFSVETPTIQLLYLDMICEYLKSYGNVHVWDLDARAIREFRRIFHDFCKVSIDIAWQEKRFDACVVRQSSASIYNQVKEVSAHCVELLKEVQAMTAQLAELEGELSKKEKAFSAVEEEEKKLLEECKGIEASIGDINEDNLVFANLFWPCGHNHGIGEGGSTSRAEVFQLKSSIGRSFEVINDENAGGKGQFILFGSTFSALFLRVLRKGKAEE